MAGRTTNKNQYEPTTKNPSADQGKFHRHHKRRSRWQGRKDTGTERKAFTEHYEGIAIAAQEAVTEPAVNIAIVNLQTSVTLYINPLICCSVEPVARINRRTAPTLQQKQDTANRACRFTTVKYNVSVPI